MLDPLATVNPDVCGHYGIFETTMISVDTDGVALLSIPDWVTPEVKMK